MLPARNDTPKRAMAFLLEQKRIGLPFGELTEERLAHDLARLE